MFLKVILVALLAVVGGLLWQYEEYRRMVLLELDSARVSLNSLAAKFEGWQVIFITSGLTIVLVKILSCLFEENIYTWRQRIKTSFFKTLRKTPGIGGKINREVAAAITKIEKEGFSSKPGETYRMQLPKKGLSYNEVMSTVGKLDKLATMKWEDGWASGAVYYCSPELTKLSAAIFEHYVWSNPLHPNIFPQVRKMEAEVVQWSVNLFNGGPEGCGIMTSGGTESIMMAMRSYREAGYARGIKFPEIVMPESAHCAFNKAADYFRMKLTLVPVDPKTRKVDLRAMSRAISPSTVVLVGSAPHYPHGIIDPIPAIADLARKHGGNIGVHVDCCLGGFILAFMEKAGFEIEPFDFRVPGVTSISADTHKFGYTPKGSSVVMYSSKALRQNQYFVATNWPGGIYATAGAPGSRAGCLVATTWATLMYMGEDGYVDATRRIVETARAIMRGLKEIPGIVLMGEPKAMVVAFKSEKINTLRLSEALKVKGWNLHLLQFPPSMHICVTMVHTKEGVVDRFLDNVRSCSAEIERTPGVKVSGEAAFYGQTAYISDRSIVKELAKEYIDLTYRAGPSKAKK